MNAIRATVKAGRVEVEVPTEGHSQYTPRVGVALGSYELTSRLGGFQ
jgi:hypothetical protein